MKLKIGIVLAALFAACSIMHVAQAEVSIYEFSGKLNDIRGSGAGLSYGETFNTSFFYDDSAQSGVLVESGREVYSSGQFQFDAGSHRFVGDPYSQLQVFNDWTNAIGGYHDVDGFFVSSYVYDRGNASSFYLLQFDMFDFTGNVLSSLAMPSQSQFAMLAQSGRVWVRRFENGAETGLAEGNFTSFTSPSSVPEPQSVVLMLAGLGLLSVLARRRKG